MKNLGFDNDGIANGFDIKEDINGNLYYDDIKIAGIFSESKPTDKYKTFNLILEDGSNHQILNLSGEQARKLFSKIKNYGEGKKKRRLTKKTRPKKKKRPTKKRKSTKKRRPTKKN